MARLAEPHVWIGQTFPTVEDSGQRKEL